MRKADHVGVVYAALVFAGLLFGLTVGRWWVVAAAAALGTWTATTTGVDEVPGWYLGAGYAVLAAGGMAAGIAVRQMMRSRP
jgi:hypothetical protein